jgi:alcohol dehydrogenase
MKAARLHQPGNQLVIEDIAKPGLRPGGVLVKVLEANVPSFTGNVMAGKMPFVLPVPYTPGPSCLGIVEDVADDVIGIEKGQKVFCAANYTYQINGGLTAKILVGWFGITPNSAEVMNAWKNGAFAEKAIYPVSCVTPLSDEPLKNTSALAPLTISYGGLLRGRFRPGQSLLVNGATGNLGAAAVLLALAMGASKVFAVGRNRAVLDDLANLAPRRVIPIGLEGPVEESRLQISSRVAPVDMLLDTLGYVASAELTLACLNTLAPGGTAVFMGGVLTDIPISYLQVLGMQWTITGSFMFPPNAPKEVEQMMQAGLFDLDAIHLHSLPLSRINEAIQTAASLKGLHYCVVTP